MRKTIISTLLLATILLSAFICVQSVSYRLTDDYAIQFKNAKISGSFGKLTGDISFDETRLDQSLFKMSVDVGSIKTGNFLKNMHAKGDGWFDAEKYPLIKFASGKFSKIGNSYEVTGVLEMHGVQKQVTIPFTFINNIFKGSFTVNRLDYKIGTMEGMSASVPAEINIELTVPVIPK